jgi:hypothetical protein
MKLGSPPYILPGKVALKAASIGAKHCGTVLLGQSAIAGIAGIAEG